MFYIHINIHQILLKEMVYLKISILPSVVFNIVLDPFDFHFIDQIKTFFKISSFVFHKEV